MAYGVILKKVKGMACVTEDELLAANQQAIDAYNDFFENHNASLNKNYWAAYEHAKINFDIIKQRYDDENSSTITIETGFKKSNDEGPFAWYTSVDNRRDAVGVQGLGRPVLRLL